MSPRSLRNLVFVGTVGVAVTGTVLFYYFAWLQTGQPWSLTGWLTRCTGQQFFDAARTAVTILGILGLGGAALIAYRRQHTNEQTLLTAIRSQETEVDRRQDDIERGLRGRYTDAATQLGSTSFAVRLAGIYALASLADDWHANGHDTERQVCIDLLCAYLRTDTMDLVDAEARREWQIRGTIVTVLRERTSRQSGDDPASWVGCRFDLATAHLVGADLQCANLDKVNLANADLECANLSGARLEEAHMVDANLQGAQLSGAILRGADLTGADLSPARVLPQGRGAHRRPTEADQAWGANLIDVGADLSDAELSEAKLQNANLLRAKLIGALLRNADLFGANLTSADLTNADLSGAMLFGAVLDDVTMTDEQTAAASMREP